MTMAAISSETSISEVSPFARYGATCFDDLNPAYYSEVFGDLMLMDEDD